MDDLARLSFNQITAERASLKQVVDACARHGVPYVAVWRDKLAELGVKAAASLLRDAGVRVSSVCRGGMFPATTREERAARIEENRRAIDQAAVLGAEVLVLVWGAAPDNDIGAGGLRRRDRSRDLQPGRMGHTARYAGAAGEGAVSHLRVRTSTEAT